MLSKKERTFDAYKKAGANMRLLKQTISHAYCELAKVYPHSELGKMKRAMDDIEVICEKAENRMYDELGDLGSKGIHVFCGALNMDTDNEVDNEEIIIAKQTADSFFPANIEKRMPFSKEYKWADLKAFK